MKDGKIHIPAKKICPVYDGRPGVKVTPEAYNVLVEIYNECQLSMKQIASLIIMQSRDLIVYDKEE